MRNYTFFKHPYNGEFKYAKIFAKFSKTKFVMKGSVREKYSTVIATNFTSICCVYKEKIV